MTFTRVRALIFVGVLFLAAVFVVLTAINKDTQTQPKVEGCEPGQVRVNTAVLDEEEVILNVFNGTSRVGLAEQISSELANRGFNIGTIGTAPVVEGITYTQPGYITYGPQGVGAGWLVKAYFLVGELEETFVPDRTGPEVDLVLGSGFQQLSTSTEVNQRIAALGPPKAPSGTCAA